MSKKYLIDETELSEYAIKANEYKEVEVLDNTEFVREVYVDTSTDIKELHQLLDHLKENKYLIVKIIE